MRDGNRVTRIVGRCRARRQISTALGRTDSTDSTTLNGTKRECVSNARGQITPRLQEAIPTSSRCPIRYPEMESKTRIVILCVGVVLVLFAGDLENSYFELAGVNDFLARRSGSAAAAGAAAAVVDDLSAWSSFHDTMSLPLLRTGVISDQSMLVHEREGDIAAFLYAERGLSFFVDAAGPVCAPRVFFAISGNSEDDPAHARTRVIIEVDGQQTGNISVGELFLTPLARDDAGINGTSMWPGHAAFPQPLTFSVEHEASVRSGLVMNAPICATSRLRLALDFRPKGHSSAAALMEDGSSCVANDKQCAMPIYINAQLLRFSAGLPPRWSGFNAAQPANPLPLGPSHRTWSSERLIDDALRNADSARSVLHCTDLPRSSSGRDFNFVVLERKGPGVASLLTLDFPGAEQLLHSKGVRLVAEWDGGRGSLDIDLEALLGPPFLVRKDDPSVRKQLFYLGERRTSHNVQPDFKTGVSITDGLYLAVPMPWWTSCSIRIVIDAGAVTSVWPSLEGNPSESPDLQLPALSQVCAAVVVMRSDARVARTLLDLDTHGDVAAGYLQGRVSNFLPSPSLNGRTRNDQILVDIADTRGSLVALSLYVQMDSLFLVEGDIRVWPDERATPAIWSTGLEDFFSGSHAYRYKPHSSAALAAWDRSVGVDGRKVSLFQIRAFMLDSPRFSSTLRVSLEASAAYALVGRSCALYYGLPTGFPLVTDELFPGDEADRVAHGYTVSRQDGSAVTTSIQSYSLDSILPSEGEGDGQRINIAGVAAIPPGVIVEFSVKVIPTAHFVELRRLVDVRYGVQRANISIGSTPAIEWLSTDRHWVHLDTHWREEVRVLPPHVTRGIENLHIKVFVFADDGGGVEIARTFAPGSRGPAWTEARWQIVCMPRVEQ